MDVELAGIAIALIVVLAGDAVACAIPIKLIKDDLDRLNCPPKLQRILPVIKFAAVAGLVIGLWIPWLGVVTCGALVLYFAAAFGFHMRAKDPAAKYVPAALFLILIAAALFLSYLPAV